MLYTEDPDDARRGFRFGDRRQPRAVVGATIDVPGAEEALHFCFDETSNAVACGVDLRVGELWMQVRTESEEALPPAVERIVANLTA